MSMENVERFYELLEIDEELRDEAFSLQYILTEQEEVIAEFIAIAERQGLFFTEEELVAHIYENGNATPDE